MNTFRFETDIETASDQDEIENEVYCQLDVWCESRKYHEPRLLAYSFDNKTWSLIDQNHKVKTRKIKEDLSYLSDASFGATKIYFEASFDYDPNFIY